MGSTCTPSASGDQLGDLCLIADGQLDRPVAAGPVFDLAGGDLRGEPGSSVAAGAGQSHQPLGLRQCP